MGRRLLSFIAVASAMVVALSAAALASAAGSGGTKRSGRSASGITWGTCSDRYLQAAHAQCGYLSVPLDYSKPTGKHIEIAVSRIEHTSTKHYQGIILTNPGGPGGSGLNLNYFLVQALKDEGFSQAAADYDWIGFDPRGVGSSKPTISCKPGYFHPARPYYVPQTKRLLDYWLSSSRSYALACAGKSALQKALLRHLTTRDSAIDMNSIREALGQQQLTYYGFSYGTYLGQVFATLFPSRVRRLILDSNVDPRYVWYRSNLNQDGPFNRNENIWFHWLAKYHKIYRLGDTGGAVHKLFYATERRLRKHAAGGLVGPDEWVDAFLPAGYYEQTWLRLGRVFAGWIHKHSARPLIAAYRSSDSPGNDNEFAVYLGVECTDAHWPQSWSRWSRDNWRIYRKAPFETWGNAWFNAPCIYWPASSSRPVDINGSRIKNGLLIDETLDAATPFSGSLEVRRLFRHAVLLAEPGGTSHADSLFGDRCVDGTIAKYLATGALPSRKSGAKWDKTCKPLPKPVPSGATTRQLPIPRIAQPGPVRLAPAAALVP